jgi:hypothetical protein
MSPKAFVFAHGLIAATLAIPSFLHAQTDASGWMGVELRTGIGWHDVGRCGPDKGSGSGGTLGLEVRTNGRWFVSSAVDVFDVVSGDGICQLDLPMRMYGADFVEVWGAPRLDVTTPRIAASIGHRFVFSDMPSELTLGVGSVRTKTAYKSPSPRVIDWRPWFGGTLTFRPLADVGVQFEWGRRQLAQRYYALGQDVVVAETSLWESIGRLGVTVPLLNGW